MLGYGSGIIDVGLRPDPPPDAGAQERSAPSGLTAGALGYGAGGPLWLDAFHSKRPPTPPELVNAYKAIAYACIGLNAKGVAKVPLRLYAVRRPGQRAPRRSFRRAGDHAQRLIRGLVPGRAAFNPGFTRAIDSNDDIDEVLDHPFLEALAKPNPFFDRELFFLYLVICLEAVGACYVFPERPTGADGLADPTWAAGALWPLQPQYVFPVKGTEPGVLLQSWRYFGDTFAPQELVRIRHVSLRDPYLSQYAPLHACYEQTTLVDYYTATVEGLLKGGARPEVVVTEKDITARPSRESKERFEREANRKFGQGRVGRVWYVDGDVDVKTLTYPPTDLGALELTKEQRLLAANCFDVPISLLQLEDSNRATAQESSYQHQYYAIDPRCRLIASALTTQLAQPVDERLFFFFDDPVMRDVEKDAKVWQMRTAAGQATLNEWRANDGLPPEAWGDEPWLSNSLVQPSQAAADREADRQLQAEALKSKADAGGDPEPKAGPKAKKPRAAERSVARRLGRVLTLLERRLDDDAAIPRSRPDDRDPGPAGALPE